MMQGDLRPGAYVVYCGVLYRVLETLGSAGPHAPIMLELEDPAGKITEQEWKHVRENAELVRPAPAPAPPPAFPPSTEGLVAEARELRAIAA